MKRTLFCLCALMMALMIGARAENYPKKNLSGVVQWGAGGGTDSLMRPLAALAEEHLGVSVVVKNMAGGTGSIAAQYVSGQASDGYTLLMGAENPALYKALGISDLTYDDFTCVLLIGDETAGFVVRADSPYETLSMLISDALARPGQVTLATTGTGGLPWEASAFLTRVTGATFNQIPYDSDASARTAVLSGECAFTVCKIQSGIEAWRAGDIRYLAMLAQSPVPEMESVPLITEEYPDFSQYLPWGPFYGVFVKKATDAQIVGALSDAFLEAFSDESYQQVLRRYHVRPLGLTGSDARGFIDTWRDSTVAALTHSGAIAP